ncbi:MAG: A/G-specific adenine glycosylase [Actinomycetota bacterium]
MSEVMLQQTQASRVIPSYGAFVRRFPTVEALAVASRADVIRAWAGLGYNRRAVALSEAAREMARSHGGRVPRDVESLRRLPGIGPYTAAAVASLAFGKPVPAVDTNVRRVVARTRLGVDAAEADAFEVRTAAEAWIDRADPGAWNQAVMDLGREVCRPTPRCQACPLSGACAFRRAGRRPSRPSRRQSKFEGSFRQVRGAVVRVLRERGSAPLAGLIEATGHPAGRVCRAVEALAAEGMVRAGPAALAGRPSGPVTLET